MRIRHLAKNALCSSTFYFLHSLLFYSWIFLFPDWIMIAWITILEMLFFEGIFYVFRCSESPHGRSGLRIVKLCFLVLVVFSCTSIWASDMMSEFGVFDWGWIEAMPKFNRHILSKFYLVGFIKELALDFLLAVAFLRLQRISLRKNNLVLN